MPPPQPQVTLGAPAGGSRTGQSVNINVAWLDFPVDGPHYLIWELQYKDGAGEYKTVATGSLEDINSTDGTHNFQTTLPTWPGGTPASVLARWQVTGFANKNTTPPSFDTVGPAVSSAFTVYWQP